MTALSGDELRQCQGGQLDRSHNGVRAAPLGNERHGIAGVRTIVRAGVVTLSYPLTGYLRSVRLDAPTLVGPVSFGVACLLWPRGVPRGWRSSGLPAGRGAAGCSRWGCGEAGRQELFGGAVQVRVEGVGRFGEHLRGCQPADRGEFVLADEM